MTGLAVLSWSNQLWAKFQNLLVLLSTFNMDYKLKWSQEGLNCESIIYNVVT